MDTEFERGDVVRHKASENGPKMTVSGKISGEIYVKWFDSYTLHEGRFHPAELVKVDPPQPQPRLLNENGA